MSYDSDGPDNEAAESTGEQSREIVAEAQTRFEYARSVDHDNRLAAREDVKFVWVKGAQWNQKVAVERDLADRPVLEINQLPQFIKQVVNDQRQIRPSIKIRPGDQEGSEETAEIIQGLIRGIEYDSSADAAYDSAFESAVTGGRGYWRVLTDYESDNSFDQVIKIQRIPDADNVTMDPDYVEPDASDIRYCFVTESLSQEEFEEKYPNKAPASWDDVAECWRDGERVIIADYFRKTYTPRKLALLRDGSTAWEDEVPKEAKTYIVTTRESEDCRVEWFKLGAADVLETVAWKGKYIPVVMCVGDEITTGGKRIFQGLIRRARDAQAMYNYWQTSATELIALAPRAPYVAAEGQIEPYRDMWDNANRKNYAVLPYKPTSIGGTPVPPPQRTQFAGVPAGIMEQAQVCKQDLRATIGIYDPSLGNRSNETSGRAIIARERQGDTATFHFVDNLRRAIQLTGRIIDDLRPHVYDTQRVLRIVGDDDSQEMITVNKTDPMNPDNVENDIRTGKYKVIVDVGPSYATKRMESADSMMQFMQAQPQTGALIGDLVARNMDWPGAEQIADRLKAMLPPQIQQLEAKTKGVDPQVQQLQQQLQQLTEQGHQAVQQVQQQAQAALQEAQQQTQQLSAKVDGMAAQLKGKEGELQIKAQEVGLERDKLILDATTKFIELSAVQGPQLVAQEAQDFDPVIESLMSAHEAGLDPQTGAGIRQMLERVQLLKPQEPIDPVKAAFDQLTGHMQALHGAITAPRHVQVLRDANGDMQGAAVLHPEAAQ